MLPNVSLRASNYSLSNTTNTTTPPFPQLPENVGSITVSCIFLVSYSIVLVVLGGIAIVYRKEFKRNQIILFLLVTWCIAQQSIGLLSRLVYNGVSLHLNLKYPNFSNIPNLQLQILPIYISSVIESVAVYLQGVVIIVIICFVLNVL